MKIDESFVSIRGAILHLTILFGELRREGYSLGGIGALALVFKDNVMALSMEPWSCL